MSIILWIANDQLHFGIFMWLCGLVTGYIFGRPNLNRWMRIPETRSNNTTYTIEVRSK